MFSKKFLGLMVLTLAVLSGQFSGLFAYQNDEPKDLFFKEFAESANFKQNDRVRYIEKANELVLFASKKGIDSIKSFAVFLTAILCIDVVMAGVAVKKYNDWKTDVAVPCAGGAVVLAGVLTVAGLATYLVNAELIENYLKFGDLFPLLTFDSKGLKKFDKYVLYWKKVDRVVHLSSTKGVEPHKAGDAYNIMNDGHINSTVFLDKFDSEMFSISSYSVHYPVSSETLLAICDYCLAEYGNEKIKAEKINDK